MRRHQNANAWRHAVCEHNTKLVSSVIPPRPHPQDIKRGRARRKLEELRELFALLPEN